MPHIHELFDFVASVYIVFENKVLMVDHKKVGLWLPIGGHIELDEDPDQALEREIAEECGVQVEIVGQRHQLPSGKAKSLIQPRFMDVHYYDESETHRHINMIYFARAINDKCVLDDGEHNDIKWFTKEELQSEEQTGVDVKYYGITAIDELAV